MSSNLLQQPQVVSSGDSGFLNVTLTLEESVVRISDTLMIRTRTYNGTIPGPTLLVKAGDVLNVRFINMLEDQGVGYKHNTLSAPDESNLHWHGLYVSGESPSDDTTIVVGPNGGFFNYQSQIPQVHHPGLHWYHPHRHASTTIQVGGGAAGAIIVDDEDPTSEGDATVNMVPPVFTNTRQVILVIQPLLTRKIRRVAEESSDSLLQINDMNGRDEQDYYLINGQVQPNIVEDLLPDGQEWLRLRIVYGSWEKDHLRLQIPGCNMELIAKDGIYLPTIPRSIVETNIPPGGRADIMVKCNEQSKTFKVLQTTDNSGDRSEVVTIANIITTSAYDDAAGGDISTVSVSLPTFSVTYPDYLQDLRHEQVQPDCSCTTRVGGDNGRSEGGINGVDFSEEHTTHYYKIGEVAERIVQADRHPYHQHVYPFQLQSTFGYDNNYNHVGDWHDTIEGPQTGVIRYRPQRFDGKIMIHCHRLDHEDEGMMGVERHADQCMCGQVQKYSNGNGLDTWAIALISAIGTLLVIVLVWICIRRRTQARRT